MAAETVEAVGKWIALIGSVFAVGQAGTAWINGQWQATAAREKAEQEIRLQDIKERSALASEYLKLIIAKDTALAERVTLLDALSSLDGHPLQKWARQRHDEYEASLQRSQFAFQAQQEAIQAKEGAERDEERIQAEIAQLTAESQLEPDNRELRGKFQQAILAKAGELAKVRAKVSVATVKVEEVSTKVTQLQQGTAGVTTATTSRSVTLTQITSKVTADQLKRYFPSGAANNIDLAAPYLQAALQEFAVSDPRLIACIIATIAVETPNFESYEEPKSAAAAYEGRADLGNKQPGDGVLYRGRGWLGVTGRANYLNLSQRLGLGTRLVDSPDDMRSPEIASRVIVAWFVDRQTRLLAALQKDDLGFARHLVNGSPTSQIERFTAVYRKVLGDLSA